MAGSGVEAPDWRGVPQEYVVREVRDEQTHVLLKLVVEEPQPENPQE